MQYATLTKGKKRRANSKQQKYYFSFRLTEHAKKEGAFVQNGNFYIPLGKLTFQIIDQEVTESDAFGMQNRVNFTYKVEMNDFGKEMKRLVESKFPRYKNSDLFRENGKLTTMLWKDPEKDMWTTSSKYEKKFKS